jgi:hypothetical protein
MTKTAEKARNTNAETKKNHASGEFGMKNPQAGLPLGM